MRAALRNHLGVLVHSGSGCSRSEAVPEALQPLRMLIPLVCGRCFEPQGIRDPSHLIWSEFRRQESQVLKEVEAMRNNARWRIRAEPPKALDPQVPCSVLLSLLDRSISYLTWCPRKLLCGLHHLSITSSVSLLEGGPSRRRLVSTWPPSLLSVLSLPDQSQGGSWCFCPRSQPPRGSCSSQHVLEHCTLALTLGLGVAVVTRWGCFLGQHHPSMLSEPFWSVPSVLCWSLPAASLSPHLWNGLIVAMLPGSCENDIQQFIQCAHLGVWMSGLFTVEEILIAS